MHSEKKGVRVFAVAESFRRSAKKSILAGVVMRRDLIVDGVAFCRATVEGDDATGAIIKMYQSMRRGDINCILLDGLVISMYNIIDGAAVSEAAGLPVIAITFEDSKGLESAIKHHFPDGWQEKTRQYKKLGKRERVTLKTGKDLYIKAWGIPNKKAVSVLDAFTLQGAVPEPVKVAKLAARSALSLQTL
ncbi:MAG TPA: DUF99 family protein [Nitrososphaera sp.]